MGLPAPLQLQRTSGLGQLKVHRKDGKTRLDQMYQQGAAKVRLPRADTDHMLHAVTINTAGGLTGGDALTWRFDVGANAQLAVSSQACERLYRSTGATATIDSQVRVGANGRCLWLPQETILFDQSRLHRQQHVELDSTADYVGCEAMLFGRLASGEIFTGGQLADLWQISVEGRSVHREQIRLPLLSEAEMSRRAVLADFRASATLIAVGPSVMDLLDRVRDAAPTTIQAQAAVSAWQVGSTGKLIARCLAINGLALRRAVIPMLSVLISPSALPKVWAT